MKGDLTAEPKTRQDTGTARAGSSESAWRSWRLWGAVLARFALAALLGAALAGLIAQIPARHVVDVGGYDAAYVQGFHDPERADQPGDRAYLAGSDGAARWSRDVSYLLFPQAGLPSELALRVRGAPQGTAVRVLLGGDVELGSFRATDAWQEHRFQIAGGWRRPSDVVIELRAETVRLSDADPREVGVLVDRAVYQSAGPPSVPYPAQLAYGGLAAGLLYLLVRRRTTDGGPRTTDGPRRTAVSGRWALVSGLVALGAAYLLLYHLQPAYPYPLRRLPQVVCVALAGLVVLRYAPAGARHAPWAADAAAIGATGAWLAATLTTGQQHLVLSVPGVEKDFRVFATRAFDPAEVFRADGFYNLGYPLLLWLVTPLAQDNPFIAARAISAASGAALLLATWWLARTVAGRGAALAALVSLALSASVAQYGLYVGSDMPFAALCALALALLVDQGRRHAVAPGSWSVVFLAGLVAGAAFLVRHPGLLLLPIGWLALLMQRQTANGKQHTAAAVGLYTLAFVLAIMPQIVVNLRDTGQPLYNQQAKNVWLAVYGDGDWGRWGETSDDVSLTRVVLQDPARFLGAWWANVRAFFGTGAEDTGEFGRAAQLRLLGFPANWLALAGMIGWLAALVQNHEGPQAHRQEKHYVVLLAWVALYVGSVSVGLSLPRFFLPLAPAYAAAAGWSAGWLAGRAAPRIGQARAWALVVMALAALLWGGFAAGASYVVRAQPAPGAPGQPPETLAAAQLIQATLPPGERLAVRVAPGDEDGLALAKYSAVAHLVAADAADAAWLLWSADLGPVPAIGEPVGAAGRYTLLRLNT